MDYEWDSEKAALNIRKHRIDFADAVGVFSDPFAITIRDDDPDEDRFVTIGSDFLSRIIVVIYTWRGDKIRVISARSATKSERKHYGKGI